MAFNSTIQEHYSECIDCAAQGDHSLKPTISDRCKAFHYNKYRREISAKKQQARQQAMRVKYLPANKKMLVEKGLVKDENLELFFKLAAVELAKSPWCWECNSFIGVSNLGDDPEIYKSERTIEQIYRDCTAHIFPKRKEFGFYSVRAHPLNKLFLCTKNGCHDRTHTWEKFVTMKVWPLALERIKMIYEFIDDREKKNIPPIVWKYIPELYRERYGHNFVESIHLLP